jgi:hypothetical protein
MNAFCQGSRGLSHEAGGEPGADDWRWGLPVLVFFGLLDTWLRWPGYSTPGFASHDVAGLTYNGMLLLDGGLPYVDSIELKAPAGFYLAATFQLIFGGPGVVSTSAFIQGANLVGTASMLGVTWMAWRNWGRASAVLAGLLCLGYGGMLDSMDANYVTWANGAAVLAAVLAVRAQGLPGRGYAWIFCGFALGVCALTKRPVAVVAPALLFWAWRDGEERTARWGPLLALGAGLLAAHLPIAVHYALEGELQAFLRGYLANEWGGAYVVERKLEVGKAISEGLSALLHFMALPVALALFSSIRASRERGHGAPTLRWCSFSVFVGAWFLLAWAATFVGLRFYKGYFVPLLPPAALLAAHPAGIVALIRGLRLRRSRSAGVALGGLLIMAAPLGVRQFDAFRFTRVDRARAHDSGGRQIAGYLRPRLEAGDRIWVWGWHLWDVYTYVGARSGSRIYKSLGLLTPPNDDTWRGGGGRAHFVDGEWAQLLLDDFVAAPPRFVVLGSTVPRREFTQLQSFLREHYRRVRGPRLGRVQYWQLKSQ